MKLIQAGETPTLELVFERIAALQHELDSDRERVAPYDPRAVLFLRRELVAVLRMLAGERRSNAKHEQRWQNVTRALGNLVHRKAGIQRDVKRLEELLLWIHRTEQPIEEIRATIERTIPRQFKENEGADELQP